MKRGLVAKRRLLGHLASVVAGYGVEAHSPVRRLCTRTRPLTGRRLLPRTSEHQTVLRWRRSVADRGLGWGGGVRGS